MKTHSLHVLAAAIVGVSSLAARAQAVVSVSWSNLQEERGKTDEMAIKEQATDRDAIVPAIAYDRLIEAPPSVFDITSPLPAVPVVAR
jgi:ABC-type xylose transport system substrate-binding protein